MSDAAEHEIEEGAFIPTPDDQPLTPFAELSRLMVVGIDSKNGNRLVWKAQTEPNGPWSADWVPISDAPYDNLATGRTHDGRVAMVAQSQGINPSIEYIVETLDQPNHTQTWDPPVSLGMPTGVTSVTQLGMTVNAAGRVAVFALTTNGVFWAFQNPDQIVEKTVKEVPPGQTEPITVTVHMAEPPETPWSDWQLLKGPDINTIRVANNSDGRVILVGSDGASGEEALYVNQQKVENAFTPESWTGWSKITDDDSGVPVSVPTVVLDREGAVNIFVVGDKTNIMQLRQDPPGTLTWSSWARVGVLDGKMSGVVASFNAVEHIVLMAYDEDCCLYSNQQIDSLFQHWLGWQKIGTVPGLGISSLDYSADGRLMHFQQTTLSGELFMLPQFTIDSSSWNAGWVSLCDGGLGVYGVVRDLTPPAASG